MIELTVILKDDERTYKEKFLHYGGIDLYPDSVTLTKYVEEAKNNFNKDPIDITVRCSMCIK